MNGLPLGLKYEQYKKCIRCGICCEYELCNKGIRKDKNKKGNCKYLIRNNDGTTSCELIIDGKMPTQIVDLNRGCAFRYNYPLQWKVLMNYKELKNEISLSRV
jgi:hypothetical protein